MKFKSLALLLSCSFLVLTGCDKGTETSTSSEKATTAQQPLTLVSQVVDATCGECQLDMEGKGCDLAVRFEGKSYYVDGAKMDDHGDAHSEDGMCNSIRQAKVSGEVKDGRFVATSFELLPKETANEDHQGESSEKHEEHSNGEHGK